MTYEFKLPFPPSVNTYYRRSGHRIHMSAKGRQFKSDVQAIMDRALLSNEGITERLSMRIELSAPTNRKYDIDNRVKAVLDALQSCGFIEDDEQVDSLSVKRLTKDDNKEGYAIVFVECFDNLID